MTSIFGVGAQSGLIMKFNQNKDLISNRIFNCLLDDKMQEHIKTDKNPEFNKEYGGLMKLENNADPSKTHAHVFREFFQQHRSAIKFCAFYPPQ